MLSTPRGFGFVLAVILGMMLVPGCRPDDGPSGPTAPAEPIATQLSATAATIPDQYIVVFNSSLPDPAAHARALVAQHGGTLRFTYTAALKGFSAKLPAQAIEALRRNPNVASVEQDQMAQTADAQLLWASQWGLSRIDQRALPYDQYYIYPNTGAGVSAYILDTGIRATHVEFGGRAVGAYSAISDGNGTNDCHGHGTHVAGIVGSNRFGVAKAVKIIGIRVLGCDGRGSISGIIAGIDWVTKNRVRPAVANMSIATSSSSTLAQAVQNSIASGVVYAVGAGNSSSDACNTTPANVAAALTVGASNQADAQESYSSYGRCLDLYAPGRSIISTWYTNDTVYAGMSGTSMAAPHVAGASALYLAANPTASPAQVASAITSNATAGVLSALGAGSPNLLLYTGFIGGASSEPPPPDTTSIPLPPPGDRPPTASFSASCPKGQCTLDATASTDDRGIVTYQWTWGDGTTATSASPKMFHAYTAGGKYTVVLVVSDAIGQTGRFAKVVNIRGSARK